MTTVFQVILFSVLFSLSFVFQNKTKLPPLKITKQQGALNFNKQFYATLSAGHQRFMSAYLWIQTLIESDLDHYKKVDLNSWMYHRFDAITFLEKKFYAAYRFGAQYLSIVKDDEKGALDIYLRGLKEYPEDYDLNFNLGFHYLFEMGDYKNSLKYFEKVMHHEDAPVYLPSLVSRIKIKAGDNQAALELLQQIYKNTPEGSPAKKVLRKRLYSTKARIDLACLNSKKDNCQKTDLDGQKYIYLDGVFKARKKLEEERSGFKIRN